jgi:hypothetical protein
MAQISSGSLFLLKRVFPIVWFGFLAFMAFMTVIPALMAGEPRGLVFFIVPVIMAILGYTILRRFVWDLVDEVYDHGDYLVVRNRGDEARIDLADVMNVSVSTFVNPPRITLRLARPSRFGTEISFAPARPFSLNPLAHLGKNEVAESLIVRVDQARSRRAV